MFNLAFLLLPLVEGNGSAELRAPSMASKSKGRAIMRRREGY